MGKDKIDYFVKFFLKNNKLTISQQAKRNALLARDLKKICSIEQSIHTHIADNNLRIHCPKDLRNFLIKFTQKGSVLKYTTHVWDDMENGFTSFDDFTNKYMSELNSDSFWKKSTEGEYKGQSMMYLCSPHIYHLIYNFLCRENFDPNYFWMDKDLNRYYIGYKTEGVMKEWMDSLDGRQPFSMPLNQYKKEVFTCPKNLNLVYFSDIVPLFKRRIEFRDKSFFYAVRKAFNLPDLVIDKEKLKTLIGITFFTDTLSVTNAIGMIAANIQARSENPNVEIWSDYSMEDDNLKLANLHILHVNSYSDSDIDSDKIMLRGKGGMLDIKEKLIGLCNFSVISRFKSNETFENLKLDYLYNKDPNSKPKFTKINTECRGFEYVLTFYL